VATAAELTGVSARYFDRDVETRSSAVSYDVDLQRRVWRASEALLVPPAPRGSVPPDRVDDAAGRRGVVSG
jgi:hypothetical protein